MTEREDLLDMLSRGIWVVASDPARAREIARLVEEGLAEPVTGERRINPKLVYRASPRRAGRG